jgi:hypothetical protein
VQYKGFTATIVPNESYSRSRASTRSSLHTHSHIIDSAAAMAVVTKAYTAVTENPTKCTIFQGARCVSIREPFAGYPLPEPTASTSSSRGRKHGCRRIACKSVSRSARDKHDRLRDHEIAVLRKAYNNSDKWSEQEIFLLSRALDRDHRCAHQLKLLPIPVERKFTSCISLYHKVFYWLHNERKRKRSSVKKHAKEILERDATFARAAAELPKFDTSRLKAGLHQQEVHEMWDVVGALLDLRTEA